MRTCEIEKCYARAVAMRWEDDKLGLLENRALPSEPDRVVVSDPAALALRFVQSSQCSGSQDFPDSDTQVIPMQTYANLATHLIFGYFPCLFSKSFVKISHYITEVVNWLKIA